MNASLSEKLSAVKWGEFRLTDIFVVKNTSNLLASDIIAGSGETPYLCASSENNAVSSYIKYDKEHLEKGNCIFIGGKTFVVTYQSKDFYSNDSHNLALYLKKGTPSKAALIIVTRISLFPLSIRAFILQGILLSMIPTMIRCSLIRNSKITLYKMLWL